MGLSFDKKGEVIKSIFSGRAALTGDRNERYK